MAEETLLDFLRHDLGRPRSDHCVHHWPGGSRLFSTQELARSTSTLAESLSDLGVAAGDRVILLCDNRPEWHIVDLAVLGLGAVNVPIYSTLTPEQIAYQVRDSKAAVAVADTSEQMRKFLEIRARCPDLKHLIQVDEPPAPDVLVLEDLCSGGDAGDEDRYWDRAARVAPDDLATIVYTSGTTGEPKGVMLSHRNIVTNVVESLPRIDISPDDLGLEFLPLCHMIERLGGYGYMAVGARRAYCSVYDVADLVAAIRPTIFLAVPRVLEKVHDGAMAKVAAAPPIRQVLFRWAIATGREAALRRIDGRSVGAGLAVKHRLADRLVLSKVRAALGGRVRLCGVGGAAVPLHVHEFFWAVGIPLLEAWGLTETSPVITSSGLEPGEAKLGAVGRPLPSYEMRIADGGELLAKGPSVFLGYWNKPEQTAEAFDDDGFFRTGDIGRVDDDGFVYITDRKKELIVTSGGKNVAPQPIESLLKRSPLVEQAVLVGDRRPCIVALLAPSPPALEAWAKDHGLDPSDLPAVLAHPDLRQELETLVESVNAGLARFEQIRRFRVLSGPLTMENDELTPTLKLKRRVVEARYAHLIEEMYAG